VEDPDFTVLLVGPAASGAVALRAVRVATGLSLWRSRQVLDSAPVTVREGVAHEVAAHGPASAPGRCADRCPVWLVQAHPARRHPARPRPVRVPVLAHRSLPSQLRDHLRL